MEHALRLVDEGRVQVLRFRDGNCAYGYNGRWFISARELLEVVAREGRRE
jgi:hypothetical protein